MLGTLRTDGLRAAGLAARPSLVRRVTLARASALPWLLLGYFALQMVSRLLVSPTLEMDEAEQVLLAQTLQWGYGAQPPLYSWLQILVFEITGEGILGLTLLKNTLLALAFLATYASLREAGGDPIAGALAACSLFLIPQIAWEAQRDLTHSVLALATTMLTVLAFIRLCRRGATADYALFGAVLAAGFLSKYNFVLLPGALLIAALSIDELRPRVLDLRLALTAAIAITLVAPSAAWMLQNQGAAFEDARQLAMGDGAGAVSGLLKLAEMTVAVAAPLALVWALALGRARTRGAPAPPRGACARLLVRSLLLAFVACAMLVVVFQVANVKDRWLLPLVCVVPAALALWFRPRLDYGAVRLVLGAGSAIALIVLVLLPARAFLGPQVGQPNRLNFPAAALARQIEARGFDGGVVLSDSAFIAGNLRLALPDARALVADAASRRRPAPGDCSLLAWDAERSSKVPSGLAAAYRALTGGRVDRSASTIIGAPLVHGPDGGPIAELGVLFPDPRACRIRGRPLR